MGLGLIVHGHQDLFFFCSKPTLSRNIDSTIGYFVRARSRDPPCFLFFFAAAGGQKKRGVSRKYGNVAHIHLEQRKAWVP